MKFKNYTKHLVAFIMLLTTLHAYAASVGDSFYYECENGKYLIFEITHSNTIKLTEVDDYECTGEVIIPFLVNFDASSYIVTEIGGWACNSRENITSVTIPESVTKIGKSAFNNCNSLTTITIPKSVTEIGERALAGCDNLTAINVDSNNLHYTSEEGVLFNIEKTKLIQCPAAKYGTYTIPDGVDILENFAFTDSKLTSIIIPNSVTKIGEDVFEDAQNLTSIEIPNSVTSLGEYLLAGCSSLNDVKLSNNITTIPVGCFAECIGLTSINIPNGVTTIDEEAFAETGLTSINFPESIKFIGDYAFAWSELTSVVIPEGVETIGEAAFAYSDPLTAINVAEDNKYFTSQNGVLFNKTKTTLIQYPCGKQGGYAIPNTVNTIAESAFEGCKNLTSVTIPQSVNTIEIYAFYECESLASVSIPEGISTIEEMTFLGCTSLKWVNIPNSVNNIKNSAFEKCKSLTSVTIPEGVTTIEDNAFEECSNLTYITIPNSVNSIGAYCFSDCENLKSAIIPEGVTIIKESTFGNCSSLKWVKIPMSVSIISQNAFLDCNSLSEIFVLSTIPPTLSYGFDEGMPFYSVNKSIPVYIPIGSISKYKSAEGWNEFTNFIESDFTGIEDSNISTTEIKVIAGNGIDICNYYGKLQVISLAGQVLKDTYVNGSAQITLPKGAYIIVTENKSQKVVL